MIGKAAVALSAILLLLAWGPAFATPHASATTPSTTASEGLRQVQPSTLDATPPDSPAAAREGPAKTDFARDAQETLAHRPAVAAGLAALLVIELAILGLVWWIANNQEAVGQLRWIDAEVAKLGELAGPRRPKLVDVSGALIQRVDHLLQRREQDQVEMRRLREDVATLQHRLEQQAVESRRPQAAARVGLTTEGEAMTPPPDLPAPPPPGPRLPDLAAVESAYRAVLPTKSRSRFQAFVDTYGAVGVVRDAAGQSLRFDPSDSSPYLQAVEVDGGYFALFPGGDIIVSFATTYSSQLSMPPVISLAFDLDVDGTRALALTQAAICRSDGSGGLAPARRGRLAGFVS